MFTEDDFILVFDGKDIIIKSKQNLSDISKILFYKDKFHVHCLYVPFVEYLYGREFKYAANAVEFVIEQINERTKEIMDVYGLERIKE